MIRGIVIALFILEPPREDPVTEGRKLSIDGTKLSIHGVLQVEESDRLSELLEGHRKAFMSAGCFDIDFADAPGIDAIPAAVLFEFANSLKRAGVRISRLNAAEAIDNLFKSFDDNVSRVGSSKKLNGLHEHFEDLGEAIATFIESISGLWGFLCNTLNTLFDTVRHPGRIRWQMVFYYMEESGVRAIPIIATLTWLLGTVLGYQAGYQMRAYGAETFMPALLAYSITWEIGPMLTAVLVAGRSGSAYAAEIGTMKVRQEVDALSVMGFDIFGYLVTPKLIALICVMPILVLVANFAGIIGGLLAGGIFLGMPASIYISGLSSALIPFDIIWGMVKAIIYAVIIANVGSYMGMRVRGGAAEVGKATTGAVVMSIFFVIVADALMSLLFVHIRPGISM